MNITHQDTKHPSKHLKSSKNLVSDILDLSDHPYGDKNPNILYHVGILEIWQLQEKFLLHILLLYQFSI